MSTITSISMSINDNGEESYTPIETIEKIVNEKRDSFHQGTCNDISFRKNQIRGIVRFMEENKEAIADAIRADLNQGFYFNTVMDPGVVLQYANHALDNIHKWTKPRKVGTPYPINLSIPTSSHIEPIPRGVVLIIAPWNYPFGCALVPLVEALAAGNVCVLKPSEVSVHCSRVMAEKLPQYLDPRVLSIVTGGVPQATELLKQRYDAICYTGNGHVGRIVAAAAAKHLTPTLLELGGKSPAIVCDDADIKSATNRIAWGKFTANTGQACVGVDYVLVVESKKEEFTKMLIEKVKGFYGEDAKMSKDYGRIINSHHTERIVNLLRDDESIEILHGGSYDVKEQYIEPTIVQATMSSKCMKEEIFGPVLPIITVPDVQSAIDLVRTNFTYKAEHPLALYVFAKSRKNQKHVLQSIPSGTATVNDCLKPYGIKTLPFGGVGGSGIGSYHGKHGFDFFSHMRGTVVADNLSYDPSVWVMYPPYTERKQKMIAFLYGIPDMWRALRSCFWRP